MHPLPPGVPHAVATGEITESRQFNRQIMSIRIGGSLPCTPEEYASGAGHAAVFDRILATMHQIAYGDEHEPGMFDTFETFARSLK